MGRRRAGTAAAAACVRRVGERGRPQSLRRFVRGARAPPGLAGLRCAARRGGGVWHRNGQPEARFLRPGPGGRAAKLGPTCGL